MSVSIHMRRARTCALARVAFASQLLCSTKYSVLANFVVLQGSYYL